MVYFFNEKPTLEIPRAAGAIIIDGKMDDPGWLGAAKAENFSETFPEEKGKPRVNTHVLVTYDDTNFYMAFFVEDDPGKIRASLRDRDEMWQDDYVGILLDTYGDA
ncbi:hydrolase, partial [candidate division KSB1 bacterium]|nr:hydrolase [candidate division KSB1 bacterium]